MFNAPACTLPAATAAMVASCAPLKATRLKSLSGSTPACSRKLRGIRWPEVELCEPKLTFLPLRSASVLMAGSLVMNTERNFSSSSRCTSGSILPPERTWACTKVKPPNQARSIFLFTSASTEAA